MSEKLSIKDALCASCVSSIDRLISPLNRNPTVQFLFVSNREPRLGDERISIEQSILQEKDRSSAIETHIAHLRSLINVFQKAREESQENIAKYRAALGPIRRLPADVLMEIFGHCQKEEGIDFSEGSGATWVASRVCRQWRDAALGCSSLWTRIHVDSGPYWDWRMLNDSRQRYFVELQIARSGDVALSVGISVSEDLRQESLSYLFATRNRWRALDLYVHRLQWLHLLVVGDTIPLPALETFSIRFTDGSPLKVRLDAPRLTSFCGPAQVFKAFDIPATNNPVRYWESESCAGDCLEDTLDILPLSPHIIEATLILGRLEHRNDLILLPAMFTHERLSTLVLTENCTESISFFCDRITLPSLKRLYLRYLSDSYFSASDKCRPLASFLSRSGRTLEVCFLSLASSRGFTYREPVKTVTPHTVMTFFNDTSNLKHLEIKWGATEVNWENIADHYLMNESYLPVLETVLFKGLRVYDGLEDICGKGHRSGLTIAPVPPRPTFNF